MKQYINVIGLLYCLFLWVSCTDESYEKSGNVIEGIPTTVSVSFGIPTADRVETRSELDKSEKNNVYNLIVFVFKKAGDEWKKETSSVILGGGEVGNEDSVTGTVSLNVTSGEKRIYAVANGIDNPLMPVESLESVTTPNELMTLVSEMQVDKNGSKGSIERGQSHLLMSGMFVAGNNENENGEVTIRPEDNNQTLSSGKIRLKHLDSEITFVVTTIPGISFVAKQWRVYNVPYSSYVFEKPYNESSTSHDAVGYNTEADYFNSSWANFEKAVDGDISKGGSFTFYMLENRKTDLKDIVADAKEAGVDPYQLREKQKKEPTGTDKEVVNGDYIYAPKYATYVEMTGSFHQEAGSGVDEKRAEVKYTIHLGYENKEADNFRSRRGCDYIYNVKVTGVESIETEVETSDQEEPTENQPGAEGDVVKSLTYLYVDAHYVTKSITFSKPNVSDDASFRVKTPYDANGIGDAATDYEWVWFVQNQKTKKGQKYVYKQGEQNFVSFVDEKYDPNGDQGTITGRRINVKDLIKLLQTKKDEAPSKNSIYDSDGNACFTVFIDEFYYPDKAASWTDFTNVENREMHILCDTRYSQDQESSLTTSNFLISQKSIKTFYDAKAKTAWGVETIREGNRLGFDDKSGSSKTNGRLNMSSYMNYQDEKWSKYINSSSNTMVSSYNKVAYACMQRNRDLNGDGKISDDEVKWYLPALNQMVGMWIGRDGYPSMEVYLFNGDPKTITTEEGRRQYHFMNSNYTMFWAEEGASIGNWSLGSHQTLDYRCVRNLGVWDSDTHGDNPKTEPLDYVQYNQKTRIFDLSYMNNKAIRTEMYTGEIAVDNELSQVNRPYIYFKVANKLAGGTVTQTQIYRDKKSPCTDYSEESGQSDKGTWRMPNQRELSLIQAYAYSGADGLVSRTRSSLKIKEKANYGSVFYQAESGLITLNQAQENKLFNVRCVKDVAVK